VNTADRNRMPGFTAEAALAQSGRLDYQGIADPAENSQAVTPAACSGAECRRRCARICDPEWPWAARCFNGQCRCLCG